ECQDSDAPPAFDAERKQQDGLVVGSADCDKAGFGLTRRSDGVAPHFDEVGALEYEAAPAGVAVTARPNAGQGLETSVNLDLERRCRWHGVSRFSVCGVITDREPRQPRALPVNNILARR
ncbi:MAG TPA: hypothetical protein VFK86_14030, partial [Bauldia sp.]|nr:hypothetical protein [Bauldia sp.]